MLRTTYPIVAHPLDGERADWFQKVRKGAFLQEKMPKQLELTDWYFQKDGSSMRSSRLKSG